MAYEEEYNERVTLEDIEELEDRIDRYEGDESYEEHEIEQWNNELDSLRKRFNSQS